MIKLRASSAAFIALLSFSYTNAAEPLPAQASAISNPAAISIPVVCYVETLFGGARPEQLDLSICTHVVEAFAIPDATGAVTPANGIPRRDLIGAARAANAKVLLALGGATTPGKTFSVLASDAGLRAKLFESLERLVVQGGYDGVDLDWEFPRPGETASYLGFVRELRQSLDAAFHEARPGTRPLLFLGISPADAIEGYAFSSLAAEADLFIEFGYDFRNPALGPWANDAKLWPEGSLEKIEGSVRGAASECIRRGLPREKLVIGLPLYTSDGRPWDAVREKFLAASLPLNPLFLESQFEGAWVTGPAAMEAKARKILAGNELAGGHAAGIALWQLGHQGTHRELTEALRRALPPHAVTSPKPLDAAVLAQAPGSLVWDDAKGSVESYDVYLASSREALLDATPGSPSHLGRVRNPRIAAPPDLSGQIFWRVDAQGSGGTARGAIWSFTAGAAKQ